MDVLWRDCSYNLDCCFACTVSSVCSGEATLSTTVSGYQRCADFEGVEGDLPDGMISGPSTSIDIRAISSDASV
jgi:hypothetical protein